MTKKKGHFNMLCDIGDLTALFSESVDIEIFLQRTVNLVARHLNAQVCSIYLYDDNAEELVLKATIGLNPDSVNRVRMKPGEGLVGKTLERLQPICEGRGSLNPDFKYFAETQEERFESFMAVPIRRGVVRIGVLAAQHEEADYFDNIDLMALRTVASQLAGAIENARLLMDQNQIDLKAVPSSLTKVGDFIKGNPASSGYAFANASVLKKSHFGLLTGSDAPPRKFTLKDFFIALEQTTHQLEDLQARLAKRLPESASLIFTAHFMILKDAKYIEKIVELILNGASVPGAVRSATEMYISRFLSSPHAYIRDKANDMEDLAGRILKNLHRIASSEDKMEEARIVIAQELYPSEILKLASEDVKGIILVSGGVTSHVAILSRSMKIPLIIAQDRALLNLSDGTPVLLDADIGNIFISPSDDIIYQYETRSAAQKTVEPLKESVTPVTFTLDGHQVHLMANINLLSELSLAKELKAEGIGLYRTEFPFLIRSNFPSEEEQYLVYKRLFETMAGKPVTIRTLDVGGDKVLIYSNSPAEANPELGLRSIRFSLSNCEIFEQQIRAILRAAPAHETLRIMFPMISSLDEFREAKQIVYQCVRQLEKEHLSCHCSPQIGMMLEIPCVLEIMEEFAAEADFFSIGTNDFVQYMLAVDRSNEKVAKYYRPYHPSVLRSLARIVRTVSAVGKDISVCGEMAHEPEYIPFLLGIGLRSLSVDPQFLIDLQSGITRIKMSDAEKYANQLLSQSTISGALEVLAYFPGKILESESKESIIVA